MLLELNLTLKDKLVSKMLFIYLFFWSSVIISKAMYMTGQNDRQTETLSGQIVILTGHCPFNGLYLEP